MTINCQGSWYTPRLQPARSCSAQRKHSLARDDDDKGEEDEEDDDLIVPEIREFSLQVERLLIGEFRDKLHASGIALVTPTPTPTSTPDSVSQ